MSFLSGTYVETYLRRMMKIVNAMNVINAEYMLANTFRSEVVENHCKNFQQEPATRLLLIFGKTNTKYVYHGVDTPDSRSVQANEEQMDKALPKIQ